MTLQTPLNKREIQWLRVLLHLQIFLIFCFGIHFAIFETQWKTIIFSSFLVTLGVLGTTAGAHRLWAHKSYKSTSGLRAFLMICHTLAGTGTIYNWVRLHRLHHKHYGTDLDPYNSSKGFFYAHFTSYCLDISPMQKEELEKIDMKDIERDKIVMFQYKYYWLLFVIVTLLLPINAPAEYWGESLLSAAYVAGLIRFSIVFHLSLLIHSAPKILGLAAGEKYPSDTNLVFLITKTYWMSYHYLAPWDYKTGEYGSYGTCFITKFIEICQVLGHATDLETVDSETVREALVLSVDKQKPVSECLIEFYERNVLERQQLFLPSKFL